jgi:hypothetical protein
MLSTYINESNIKVTNYINNSYLYETIVCDLEHADFLIRDQIEVKITGCAPQRKPFQSWESIDVGKFANVRDAINAGYTQIFVKDYKTVYGF